ncbi:unnamed protein product [Phytophthora lilii]|uniref:Unnamed protein product n=1 Tax=Phytophthora lilii TaxID=2077276 RepID=A0A9W6U264_9STRA|nr:unnamed protein product [Phytophthora lilii]
MPQEDTAPYDDGSSTESECYDDELLEIKTEAADATCGDNSPPEPPVDVKSPEYAEAAAIELQQVKKERQEKRAKLPPFERKTPKRRYEEQFQIVGGKTARERRLAHRDAEKKKLLASRRMAKKAKKANKTSKSN